MSHPIARLVLRLAVLTAALTLAACAPSGSASSASPVKPTAADASSRPSPRLPATPALPPSPSPSPMPTAVPSLPPPSPTPSPLPTATPPARTTTAFTLQETRGAVTLVTTIRTTRYEIGGATAAEMDTAMRTQGPVDPLGGYHWFALTEPLFDWRYTCPCGEGGCVTGPVTIYLTVSYTFPRWVAPAGADPTLTAQWAAFESALTEHERGHGALAVECAWALGEAFVALPPSDTCYALDAAVLSASEGVFAACRESQRRYEDETDHGRTQGVIWPPG